MNIEKQNLNKQQNPQLNIGAVSRRKYWYRDDVEVCVICGKETHNKERVYKESEKGINWKDGACWSHF